MDDVRTHIAEARSGFANETDADLLNILDRLGDPSDTAAAEIGRAESKPANQERRGILEIAAIIFLLLFWPVGVVLLWISDAWTTRDKLIGTLVPPGGYLALLFLGPLLAVATVGPTCRTVSDASGRVLSSTCPSGGLQTLLSIGLVLIVIIYLIGPILSAAYLGMHLRRARRGQNPIGRSGVTGPVVDAAGSP